MPALTSLGIGSGIDLNTMLTQLVAVERRPLEQMRAEASKLQTKVSSFGQIQSLVSRVQDAANTLKGASLWSQSTAKSANEAVVTAVGGSSYEFHAAHAKRDIAAGKARVALLSYGSTSLSNMMAIGTGGRGGFASHPADNIH